MKRPYATADGKRHETLASAFRHLSRTLGDSFRAPEVIYIGRVPKMLAHPNGYIEDWKAD